MKYVKFDGVNCTYRAPDTMPDTCGDLPVQKAEGKIVSFWEFTDDELQDAIKNNGIYICVEGNVQPPIYPCVYNPLTDILSFRDDIKGDKYYLILTKLWEKQKGTIDYYAWAEITPEDFEKAQYTESYYSMVNSIEEKIGRTLMMNEIVLRLAIGVRELTQEDIIPLLSTSYVFLCYVTQIWCYEK
jgi:hypothetical protein